jgi:alpha-tubulin suppressor-like RCC1 family protein
VDTNSYQTCALLVDGSVWCWGRDYVGTARPAPWRVGNLDGVTQISLGSYSACALRGDGTVRCWGMRDQFDDSGLDSPTVAVPVTSIAGADSVATPVNAGCVTLEVGSAQCWGNGYFGIDGWPIWDGAGSAIDDVVQVGGGALYTCVLRSDATMYCGDRGPLLGAPVDGLAPVAFFVAADFHVCAVTWDSELYCWGVNGNGQLGDGTLIDSVAPELIVSY